MNEDWLESRVRLHIVRWVDDMASPSFALPEIRKRASAIESKSRLMRNALARTAIAAAAAAIIALIAPDASAFMKSITSTLNAFIVGGHVVKPTTLRDVSIDEARRDMPFHVLQPGGIPESLQPTITEVFPSSDHTGAQLWFHYVDIHTGRHFTLLETAKTPTNTHRGEVVVTQTDNGTRTSTSALAMGGSGCISISQSHGGQPVLSNDCPTPSKGSFGNAAASLDTNNGSGSERGPQLSITAPRANGQRLSSAPVRWTIGNTAIALFDGDGILTQAQRQALYTALSKENF